MIGLDGLFKPDSVAIIGASANPSKWGNMILSNIINGGYTGILYSVNPKEDNILGIPTFHSLKEIPDKIDTCIVATPQSALSQVIKECGEKGVKFVVVITAGYGETGEEGRRAEREILQLASRYGIRIVGPNCMGIFGSEVKLIGLMAPIIPKKGFISFVSQSGNIGVQILTSGASQGIGFSKFVSSGNEADLHSEDYLEYFGEDPETNVIVAYIEGIKDGRKFLDVTKKITKRKPLIVFKSGKTKAGGRAARSHVGALAGSREIHNAAFKQVGIIQAYTTSEILDLAAAFSNLPSPKGNKVAIISAGGGWGVVCADACVDSGLDVIDLPEDVIREFDNYLPSYWSKNNPIDLVASSIIQEDSRYLETLIRCEDIDSIISMGLYINSSKIREFMDRYNKPIISVFLGGDEVTVTDERTVSYNTPERAANVLSRMYEYERLSMRD